MVCQGGPGAHTEQNETHEVSLTFFVEPGNRVYVRNITFGGANRINDQVLRRELRQLERRVALEHIARALQAAHPAPALRQEVDSETTPVPGAPDLVDVKFNVEEGRAPRSRAASATPNPSASR